MGWLGRREAEIRGNGFPLRARGAPAPFPFVPVAALFALLSSLAIAVALLHLRAQELELSRRLTESLAQVIAEQTSRSLQALDERLQLAISRLQAAEATGQADETRMRALLREQLEGLPFVRAMWVMDAQGRIVRDSDVGNIGVSLADREYFQAFLRDPSLSFHIGDMVRSRSTGHWLMSVSRALRGPAGEFRGIMVAAVEPPHFVDIWRTIDLGSDGAVALFRRDGMLMMRSPHDDNVMGRNFAQIPLFAELNRPGPSGSSVVRSMVDHRERLVAWRVLPSYRNLIVTVGSGYVGILAPWRRFALLTTLTWLAAVATAAVLVRQVLKHARRRKEDEDRFRQIAQAMPQIVFITDGGGAVQFINDRWNQATGRPVELAQGEGWVDAVHPEDQQRVREGMARALRSGEALELEHRLQHADGGFRWRLLRAVPNRTAEGEIASWYGTSTDIDELKRAQGRLASQAEFLAMAGRLSQMGGWRFDIATREVTWSTQAAELLDFPPDYRPTFEEVMDMFIGESRDVVARTLRECMGEGKPFDVVVQIRTMQGRPIWLRSIGRAVRDAGGAVVRLEGAQQDVTERQRLLAEVRELNASLEEKIARRTEDLARQEALFRAVAEQAPLPIWTCDNEGMLTYFSRAWYELVGGEPPKWLGREWLQLVHPDDMAVMANNWYLSTSSGKPYAGARRIRASDGSYHMMSYRATPVRGADGEVSFWVGVEADITELKASEAALRLSNQELESFSYTVSHDLRSPLQRAGSYTQLLGEELGEGASDRARHFLSRIRAGVDHMTQLIDGLLALSQVAQAEIGKTRVDLSVMADDILERLKTEHPARVAVTHVEPGLVVWADRALIRSVMENLLENAWKFSSRRGQTEISFGGSVERGEYFVRDNGAGFDMSYASKLFGTFQRLHTEAEFEGTGIGLATVARIVKRHGGRIWAIAEPDHGATFYFTLPAGPTGG